MPQREQTISAEELAQVTGIDSFGFQCGFCGKDIEDTDPALAILVGDARDLDNDDLIQQWWVHPECFIKALHDKSTVRPELLRMIYGKDD